MEDGEVGHLGRIVEKIARRQDLEVATILLQQMEDQIVMVIGRHLKIVLEDYVQIGEDGQDGHHVNAENVTIL